MEEDTTVRTIINTIQNDIIGTDIGGRGMKPLIVQNDLYGACETLAKLPTPNCLIVLLSGFPCCIHEIPPTETDGPPGTLAIARACLSLGHKVAIVTDVCNEIVFRTAIDVVLRQNSSMSNGEQRLSLEVFSPQNVQEEGEKLKKLANDANLIIACERAGQASDGNCYTMKGISMNEKNLIAPAVNEIVTLTKQLENVAPRFIAIGDGGNELGMGKVYSSSIINNPLIHDGKKIGCVVPADYLIAASVSNWGGYAICGGVALISFAENNSKHQLSLDEWVTKCLPSEEEEIELLNQIVKVGCRDGVTGKAEATVDGMPLETSLRCLSDIRNAILSFSSSSLSP